MEWETMRDVGIEFHKTLKGMRWDIHADMVFRYLEEILRKKGIDAYLIGESALDELAEIAYGHDILKDIDGHVSCTLYGTTYEAECSPDTLLPYTTEFISEYLSTNFQIEDDEKKTIEQELIAVGKFHGLNAAAFLNKQGNMTFRVLTAILMHQCPVPSLYNILPDDAKTLVECTILADKCARNYVRALIKDQPVPVLLHTVLFGEDGTEFNYSSSLLIARIIGQGKSPTEIQKQATKIFRDRCKSIGLFVPEKSKLKHLGTPHLVRREGAKEAMEEYYGKLENEVQTEVEPGGDNEEGSESTE